MADTREVKHLQRLKALYTAGRFVPNALDQQGLCHIHHAAYRGYLVCTKWLIKRGSSLTARSAEGSVPAHYAAAGGHLECLKWIHRKASKSISLTDNSGVTPLYFAAQEGHLNCLAWLAKHSGTFHREMSVDGMTTVHAAALEGHLGCLVFLLSSTGCSALARDRTANTPLHYAAACGRRSCVEWLLGNISSVGNERNKLGSSPLHVAAQNGHLEVVKLLVRAGVAIKLRDRLGRTPFDVAIESGNGACANLLYKAETFSIQGMNGLISGHHSLKRVRFERKAIERDRRSEKASTHQQSRQLSPDHKLLGRGNTMQNQHLLYKNSVDAISMNHHSNLRMESDGSKSPKGVAPTDQRYAGRLSRGFDPSSEDLHVKSHATRSSLIPWSRVYQMTQSTELLPNHHQSKVYSSYSLSDASGRDDSSPERQFTSSQHYVVTNYEDVSSEKRNTSFFSRIVSWRKNKDLFSGDFDRFDDIVETGTEGENFIKRLYKFSKRKVTRSSSFALESLPDNVLRERRNSFVVSGNDEFLSGIVSDSVGDPCKQEKKGEKLVQQTHKEETSTSDVYRAKGNSSKNEKTSRDAKKTRKRHKETIPRENSLIW